MSKYEKMSAGSEPFNVKEALTQGEELLWSGRPKKSAFIINKTVTMLPIAIVWLAFDLSFIIPIFSAGLFGETWFFMIPFFAIHLMPVWIWLGNVLTAKKKWDRTQYAVTDRRIIIQTGLWGMNYESIFYKDISNVQLRVGLIDRLLKVGDIYFQIAKGGTQSFLDVENVYELYPKLQKTVMDIQTDIEYPNDLRPLENRGYRTKYKG